MKIKQDVSYGVIPLIQENEVWHVLLINQISRRGDVYWTLPKGHPEAGETPEETALRELTEETGLELTKLDTDKKYTQAYEFIHEDIRVEKSVVYFLGFAKSKEFSIQEEEVKEAEWMSFEVAIEKLTHHNPKKMLQVVRDDLA